MALVAVSCELFSGEFRLTGKLTGTWRFSGHHFAADSWYGTSSGDDRYRYIGNFRKQIGTGQ
jgi:hypothetical protein